MRALLTNRNVYARLRAFYEKHPSIQPLFRMLNRSTFKVQGPRPITFSGWGMSTEHALPWDDETDWGVFRETFERLGNFEFPEIATGHHRDSLLWRNWQVAWCTRFALEFADTSAQHLTLVECGVEDGMDAYFTLREASAHPSMQNRDFTMHLYDAWEPMKDQNLLASEKWREGSYQFLSVERTQRNLREFESHLRFHKGHIPESLDGDPVPEAPVIYVCLELGSTIPTLAALEYFLPRMCPQSVILIHDYGHPPFFEMRRAIDLLLKDHEGSLLKLPTGQAIFFIGGKSRP